MQVAKLYTGRIHLFCLNSLKRGCRLVVYALQALNSMRDGNILKLILISLIVIGCDKKASIYDPNAPLTNGSYEGTPNSSTSTGTATQSPPPTSYAYVTRDAALSITNQTTGTAILFDNVHEDRLHEYTPATGIFTAANPGLYQVTARIGIPSPTSGWQNGNYCEIFVIKSDGSVIGTEIKSMYANAPVACTVELNSVVSLQQGQAIKVAGVSVPAGATYPSANNSYTNLTVYRLDSATH